MVRFDGYEDGVARFSRDGQVLFADLVDGVWLDADTGEQLCRVLQVELSAAHLAGHGVMV